MQCLDIKTLIQLWIEPDPLAWNEHCPIEVTMKLVVGTGPDSNPGRRRGGRKLLPVDHAPPPGLLQKANSRVKRTNRYANA